MKRIYWLTVGLMDKPGGGERIILEGLQIYRSMGIDAVLLLIEQRKETELLFNRKYRVKIVDLDKNRKRSGFLHNSKLRRWISVRRNLQKIIQGIDRDNLIIANGIDECLLIESSRLFAPFRKPRYVTFIHGSKFQFDDDLTKYCTAYRKVFDEIRCSDEVYRQAINCKRPRLGLSRRIRLESREMLKFWAVRKSRAVFVLSKKTQREIELLFRHPNVNVVSAGGFSTSELKGNSSRIGRDDTSLESKRKFLSICRLVNKKRVDFILKAFACYTNTEKDRQCVFVVGGSGPQEEQLKSLADRLGIRSQVDFPGYIPEEKIGSYYRSCDVFLQADNADYDLTTMAALSYLKNVVVTKQFDFPDGLDKTQSLIFTATNDIENYAAQMSKAIQAPKIREKEIILSELKTITWEQYFQRILAVGIEATRKWRR